MGGAKRPLACLRLRKPITEFLMENGELLALKPHQEESSTACWVKTGIVVHGLYTYQGFYFFFQLNQAEDEVLV